ncbi:hypothetical protein GCK32_020981 [Trichostrongylus colubriformis]|uniref:Uncharacterized protein n=1 Tax=Trichostrongylus colubriformis TaxID=6319 RepID=A0AAN8IPS1_TRICO
MQVLRSRSFHQPRQISSNRNHHISILEVQHACISPTYRSAHHRLALPHKTPLPPAPLTGMYCISPNKNRQANPRLVRGRIVYKSKRTLNRVGPQRSEENLLATIPTTTASSRFGSCVGGGSSTGSARSSATGRTAIRSSRSHESLLNYNTCPIDLGKFFSNTITRRAQGCVFNLLP